MLASGFLLIYNYIILCYVFLFIYLFNKIYLFIFLNGGSLRTPQDLLISSFLNPHGGGWDGTM